MPATANELYAPLGLPKPGPARARFRFGLLEGGVVAGLAVGGLLVAGVLLRDPYGGEPRAVVAMPAMPQSAPPAAAAAREAPAPVEAHAAAAPPEAAPVPAPPRQTVSIITPGGPGQPMQVRNVEFAEGGPPGALRPAPDPRLVERNRQGLLLPRVGVDGARPWRTYARPVEGQRQGPRIAVMVGGLGLAAGVTNDAISRLPADVTLAFAPYGNGLQAQVNRARQDGHEVMLQLPMEPFDYPANDPGPQTLLTSLDAERNRERLHWALARFSGYTGVTNYMGARFTSTPAALRPVLAELRGRGLIFADDGSSPRSLGPRLAREVGLGHAASAVTLDADPTPARIDEALARLEDEASRTGSAFGVASAYPVTIERLVRWSRELERKGIVLVPVSALVTGERTEGGPRS